MGFGLEGKKKKQLHACQYCVKGIRMRWRKKIRDLNNLPSGIIAAEDRIATVI